MGRLERPPVSFILFYTLSLSCFCKSVRAINPKIRFLYSKAISKIEFSIRAISGYEFQIHSPRVNNHAKLRRYAIFEKSSPGCELCESAFNDFYIQIKNGMLQQSFQVYGEKYGVLVD